MTSLPAVPHSLPPLARLARPPRAPSSPPPRPLAAQLARSGSAPARRGSRGWGDTPAPRAARAPAPKPRGARCPRADGRTHGAPEAPTGRLRGDPGQWPRGRGAGELVTPARAARRPARPGASRSFLGPRPPRRLGAPPAKLSLSSSFSLPPAAPLCLCSRWEGLGLPEVPGMGPGPTGCSRTRPPARGGGLAVSIGLGEGTATGVGRGLLRERPRVWG